MKQGRWNALDIAFLLLTLSILGALLLHVTHPAPLRRTLTQDAERIPLTISVSCTEDFLDEHMKEGDVQMLEKGTPGIELISFQKEKGTLLVRFRVYARKWKEWWQYGSMEILPGEKFEFFTKTYKLIGTITHVDPK